MKSNQLPGRILQGSLFSVHIDVASAAEVSLNGAFDALRCKLAGACEWSLIGGGGQLALDLAGAAEIHAEHCMENHVISDGAGAVDATVHVQKWLAVDLAGAGAVRYACRPEQIVEEIQSQQKYTNCHNLYGHERRTLTSGHGKCVWNACRTSGHRRL